MAFYVQAPILVFREFMRHRTFSHNEAAEKMEAAWANLMPLTHAAFGHSGRVCPWVSAMITFLGVGKAGPRLPRMAPGHGFHRAAAFEPWEWLGGTGVSPGWAVWASASER